MNTSKWLAWRPMVAVLLGVGLTAPTPAAPSGFGEFLENVGQFGDPVIYRTYVGNAAVWFTEDGIVLDLVDPASLEKRQTAGDDTSLLGFGPASDADTMRRRGCVVRVRFDAANPDLATHGQREHSYRTNYFLGNDPHSWCIGVRSFQEIVYEDVWPGIDLVWRVAPGRLEYETLVSPEADISRARFSYEGADLVLTDPDGVRIETSFGAIVHHLPSLGEMGGAIAFGEAKLNSLQTRDSFDMEWCTYLGGTEFDWGTGIAVDGQGRPVVVGWTQSLDFPTTTGAYDESLDNSLGAYQDAFITMLDANATTPLWSTYLGGQHVEEPVDVVFDADGDVVLTGRTFSPNFPTTAGAFDETASIPAIDSDVFVTKIAAGGGSLVWSTYLGKGNNDRPYDLALDSQENVVIAGQTFSNGFPTTSGALKETFCCSPYSDGFLTKLAAAGDALIWSTLLGGDDEDEWALTVTLDAQDNVLVGGGTQSANFVTTTGAYDEVHNGGSDGFLAKISPDGSSLVWSTFLGGSLADLMFGVAIEGTGAVLAAGRSRSDDFPVTAGAFDTTFNPPTMDAVVLRMSADGSALVWSTYLGGSTSASTWYPGNYVTDLEIGPLGSPVVVGLTTCADFPTTADASQGTFAGGRGDGFITFLKHDGSELLWSTFCGGSNDAIIDGFGADGEAEPLALSGGNVYVVGVTEASDFPTSPSGTVWDSSFNGTADATVLMIPMPVVAAPEVPARSTERLQLVCSPNPFRRDTRIHYTISATGHVQITVHDTAGRLVRVLRAGERLTAGSHLVPWDGRSEAGIPVAGGVYFVRLKTAGREVSQRVVLLR